MMRQRIDEVKRRVTTTTTTSGVGGEARVEACINNTHFDVRAQPILQITPAYLGYCWRRGLALQMAHMQDGIDGILPVFVGDLDRAWSDDEEPAGQMTYVAWEVKNRKEPRSPQGKHTSSDERQGQERCLPVFVGDLDRAWSDDEEPAGQMTYVAWEVKNRKEPRSPQGKHTSSDERQGQERCTTLAGPSSSTLAEQRG